MYLISAYFDDMANKKIQYYIDCIEKTTGNTFMSDNKVPPHITISAFNTNNEKQLAKALRQGLSKINPKDVQWVSVGMFLPYVIYLSPVLNSYLHSLSLEVYNCLAGLDDIKISPYYRPFSWMPHTTVGKKLSKDEMLLAFEVLQNRFGSFSGQITKIGLAKTNPYNDMYIFELH